MKNLLLSIVILLALYGSAYALLFGGATLDDGSSTTIAQQTISYFTDFDGTRFSDENGEYLLDF